MRAGKIIARVFFLRLVQRHFLCSLNAGSYLGGPKYVALDWTEFIIQINLINLSPR
jgi:hypothetical protein